jgi:hypothetical protein
MTLSEFKYLDTAAQAVLICQKGTYLAERDQYQSLIVLYQLYDFYAEVYFLLDQSQIVKILSFHSEVLLEPYLAKVSLEGLLDEGISLSCSYIK